MPQRKLRSPLTLLLLVAVAVGLLLRSHSSSPVAAGAAESGASEAALATVVSPAVSAPAALAAPVASAASSNVFVEFDTWLHHPSADRAAWIEAGRQLALTRREVLKRLIAEDPAAALELALSYTERQLVPAELRSLLETPFSTVDRYDVVSTCTADPRLPATPLERTLTIDGEARQAHTFGDRLDTTSKSSLPSNGIYIDEAAAVSPDPVRTLNTDELAARGYPAGTVAAEVAGSVSTFASADDLQARRTVLLAAEKQLGPDTLVSVIQSRTASLGETEVEPLALSTTTTDGTVVTTPNATLPGNTFTAGVKKILYIRARFADEASTYEPITLAQAQSSMTTIEDHYYASSYGTLDLTTTYTATVTLPQPSTYYTSSLFATLLSNARAAALAANSEWDTSKFTLYVLITSNKAGKFPYAGRAYVGAAGLHCINGYYTLRTLGHELGHNFGLYHASYYRTDAIKPTGRDTIGTGGYVADGVDAEYIEYGHRYSLMSAQSETAFNEAAKPHFSAYEKVRLSWLKSSFSIVSTSGTYRLRRLDATTAGGIQGIRIDRAGTDYTNLGRRYWLNYRRAFNTGVSGTYSPHGIQIDWNPSTYTSKGTIQVDMTPFTSDTASGSSWTTDNTDKEDGVLLVGRTYSDLGADIHITPVATGGTTGDEWIDVRVELASTGNTAPQASLTASSLQVAVGAPVTFTATGSDANGDTLYYSWNFGDNSLVPAALNSTTATKTWTTAGRYTVTATVSDGKGGLASAKTIVTVGTPAANGVVWGRVLCGGKPVAGARVFADAVRQTWTLADGTYALAGLTPGTTYTLKARLDGLTFDATFTNPVAATSSPLYGYDFHSRETSGLLANVASLLTGSYRITVSPYEAGATAGSTIQYRATVWDGATGALLGLTPSWNATSGTINSGGLLASSSSAASATVTATLGSSSGSARLVLDGSTPATTTPTTTPTTTTPTTTTPTTTPPTTTTPTTTTPPTTTTTTTTTGAVTVSIASSVTSVSESTATAARITVTRTGATTRALTVHFTYSGTATYSTDFSGAVANVLIPIGSSSASITLTPVKDSLTEANETLNVAVKRGSGYTPGTPGTVAILVTP